MNAITTALSFQGMQFKPAVRENQVWLRLSEIESALGYEAKGTALARIYARHADEFTATMTKVIKVMTAGGKQAVRFFSLRGAHLLAMFARTAKAKEFRVWVLNILDREVADLEAKAAAGDRIDSDTKMELSALCSHMEYLRSWWDRYDAGIRGINRNAAGAIHDHFSDAAGIARSLTRQFGFKSRYKEASGYPWDAGPHERWQYSMKTMRGAQ